MVGSVDWYAQHHSGGGGGAVRESRRRIIAVHTAKSYSETEYRFCRVLGYCGRMVIQ